MREGSEGGMGKGSECGMGEGSKRGLRERSELGTRGRSRRRKRAGRVRRFEDGERKLMARVSIITAHVSTSKQCSTHRGISPSPKGTPLTINIVGIRAEGDFDDVHLAPLDLLEDGIPVLDLVLYPHVVLSSDVYPVLAPDFVADEQAPGLCEQKYGPVLRVQIVDQPDHGGRGEYDV